MTTVLPLLAATIVTRQQRPLARALAEGFLAHHPGARLAVLVLDESSSASATPANHRIDWLTLTDLGLDRATIHRLAATHDAADLATALKPRLLRQLLQSSAVVLYLSPHSSVYGALDVVPATGHHGVNLVPYSTALSTTARSVPGVFNTGIFAVTAAAEALLDWWSATIESTDCDDPLETTRVDQRALDLAAVVLAPQIVRGPEYGVGHWNVLERPVTRQADRWMVGGVPLRTWHFEGFDPRRPWLLHAASGDRPQLLLSEHPAVAALCADYAAALARAGLGAADQPYGWDVLASGLPMTRDIRRLYREATRAAERDHTAAPPDPFDEMDTGAFTAWLNRPATDGPRRCSRYLYAIYQRRADVRIAFPDLHYADVGPFLDWIRSDGVGQEAIPAALLPVVTPDAAITAPALLPGVTVAGYFRAEFGIGEAGRALVRAVEAAGIPCATASYDVSESRQAHPFRERHDSAPYDVNLVCVNAVSTPRFAGDMGRDFFAGRHTVGYWFWETEWFPRSMHAAFDVVDEVWTATAFVADAVRAAGRTAVHVVPLPLLAPEVPPELTRQFLGLPDRFIFLFVFDFLSVVERKNPLGLIAAFTQAFAENEGPLLLLKSINGDRRLAALEQLKAAAAGRRDIRIVDGYESVDEKNALISQCDCYVSLHRSEGLGLTMAEAMAAGRPVIATGYSGNRHFMTPENSHLVDYRLSSIPAGCEPYPAGSVWADPDLDHAARLMREVVRDPAAAAARAARGRDDLRQHHGLDASAAAVRTRLAAIRHARAATPAAAPPASSAMHDNPHLLTEAALSRLTDLIHPRLSEDGRALSGIRAAAQRSLLRILRPYWMQQSQFNQEVVKALSDLTATVARQEQSFDELRTRTHEVQQTLLARSASLSDDLRRQLGAPEAHPDADIETRP